MSYYDTIEDDLARAKAILERGKTEPSELPPHMAHHVKIEGGGTIYGADIYAAYKLLESFVAEIERLRTQVADIDRSHEVLFVQPLLEWAQTQPGGEGIATGEIDWGQLVARIIREHGRLRALVDAVGEDVCKLALRNKRRS